MDEGDLDFSNPEVFSGPNAGEDLPSSCSMDSFFDNIFNDSQQHTCTHTHTCNPPGPDLSHTHTCLHVHTKIVSASADETAESVEKSSSTKKRSFGNREAVRKYREKKKAHAASLEEEVAQLRAINQQLMKRLQNQAALEVEVARLKCLLVDLRGRIEGEIGSFPYQKPMKGNGDFVSNVTHPNMLGDAQVLNSCGFSCDDQVPCLYPGIQGKNVGENGVFNHQDVRVCEIGNLQCMGNSTLRSKDFFGCGNGVARPVGCSSKASKIEGGRVTKKDS
ncbi:basic leucine zipper 19 [Canna indica]|uniref:Basic leucine zipper 19 n=1 Tax=Canna indica TaxID=4628 RepID=A0AAQ3L126_9LILI|nr:basic leucine zipper 19 [Canna indica]